MANDIFAGTAALDALYVGSSEIAKVYQGSNLIWEPDTPPPVELPESFYTNFNNETLPNGEEYAFGVKTAPTTEPMPVTAGRTATAGGTAPFYPALTGNWATQFNTGNWEYYDGVNWQTLSGGSWIYVPNPNNYTYHTNTTIGKAISDAIFFFGATGFRRIS